MTTLDKMLQGLANALGASLSTLTTTAKTIVGAINELATAVSSHTSTIGSGTLDTDNKTLIGAVNEIKAKADAVTAGTLLLSGSASVSYISDSTERYAPHKRSDDFTLTKWTIVKLSLWTSSDGNVEAPSIARLGTTAETGILLRSGYSVGIVSFANAATYIPGYASSGLGGSSSSSTSVPDSKSGGARVVVLPPGQYCFATSARTSPGTSTVYFEAISLS